MTVAALTTPQKSTIVRLFVAPPQMRALFRLLEHTAPALGARWAERIWFTLPRRREPAGPGVAELPAGMPFAVDVDGHRVVGESWGTGPVVYLVHGWAGHRGQLTAFVPPLMANGYRVVAFDAPSHGASAAGAFGPRSSSIPEFTAALTAVATAHGPACSCCPLSRRYGRRCCRARRAARGSGGAARVTRQPSLVRPPIRSRTRVR